MLKIFKYFINITIFSLFLKSFLKQFSKLKVIIITKIIAIIVGKSGTVMTAKTSSSWRQFSGDLRMSCSLLGNPYKILWFPLFSDRFLSFCQIFCSELQVECHDGKGSKRGETSKADHFPPFHLSTPWKLFRFGLWRVNTFNLSLPIHSTSVLLFHGWRRWCGHHSPSWWEGHKCFLWS